MAITSDLAAFQLSNLSDNSSVVWSGVYVGAVIGYGWMDLSIGDGRTEIANPPYGAFACGPALTGNKPFEFASQRLLVGNPPRNQLANWEPRVRSRGDIGWINVEAEKTLIRPFDALKVLCVPQLRSVCFVQHTPDIWRPGPASSRT